MLERMERVFLPSLHCKHMGASFPHLKPVEGTQRVIQGEIKTAELSLTGNCFSGPRPDSGNRFCVMPNQPSVE